MQVWQELIHNCWRNSAKQSIPDWDTACAVSTFCPRSEWWHHCQSLPQTVSLQCISMWTEFVSWNNEHSSWVRDVDNLNKPAYIYIYMTIDINSSFSFSFFSNCLMSAQMVSVVKYKYLPKSKKLLRVRFENKQPTKCKERKNKGEG